METRRVALLGVLLFASLQVYSEDATSDWETVIGQEFDAERIPAIQNLLEECSVLDIFKQPLSESCIDRLAEHFESQPVWEQSLVYYPSLDRFVRDGSVLNLRSYTLNFSQSDVTGDVPVWGEILDGNVEERGRILEQVLQEEKCMQLLSSGPILADGEVSNQCQPRELVKYAIYLDACVTGLNRINRLLLAKRPIDGVTNYEHIMREWDSLPTHKRDIEQAKLSESMMHAVWMRNACEHIPVLVYDDAFRSYEWNTDSMSVSEMAKHLQNTHDAAMAKAARSGDTWAVQGFYLRELRFDKDYWKSLYDVNPLLFHRWMTVIGASNGHSKREVVMHALKAYDLEKHVLDNPDFEDYIKQHRLQTTSETVQSLKEDPLPDGQLMRLWIDIPDFE